MVMKKYNLHLLWKYPDYMLLLDPGWGLGRIRKYASDSYFYVGPRISVIETLSYVFQGWIVYHFEFGIFKNTRVMVFLYIETLNFTFHVSQTELCAGDGKF